MLSRFDHLIHKHATQHKRRVVRGVLLMAAASVAATLVLVLGMSGTAQAHDPS